MPMSLDQYKTMMRKRGGGASPVSNEVTNTPTFNVMGREMVPTSATRAGIKFEPGVDEDLMKFQKIGNLMTRMVAQKKAQLPEVGGGGLVNPQYWLGKGKAALKVGDTEATAAFPGQVTETAMALNSLLTGQNRVIKSVLERIIKTLPDESDPASFAANKISQSLYNSFALWKAMQDAGITNKKMSMLTDEQGNDPNSIINRRIAGLKVRPLTEEQMKSFEPFIAKVLQTLPAKKWDFEGNVQPRQSSIPFNKPENTNTQSKYKILSVE